MERSLYKLVHRLDELRTVLVYVEWTLNLFSFDAGIKVFAALDSDS